MQRGLNTRQQFVKRVFDLFFSVIGILFLVIPIIILIILSSISTKKIGLFSQHRIGKHARLFTMYKIRTMIGNDDESP
ncbi:MAG: sugar transferase, partial [Flavobacteriaceae bacterium]|nr:sugar transferase [Flavobacteriaceae bacterium]